MAGLEAGIPVLLEKPLAAHLADGLRLDHALKKSSVGVLLGYTWRWWPALARARELIREGSVGTVRHVQFNMAAHLADWHPWERYQDFFMASKAQGGGALLDESHWLDLMVWFFGMPTRLFARVGRISDLQIETDDCVDMVVEYGGGMRVTLHLDLIARPHDKSIRFVGERGTLVWTAEPNRIAVAHEAEAKWQTESFEGERNDMFMAVAREFMDVMDGAQPRTCTVADGVRVMGLVEVARISNEEGRMVALGEEAPR